MRRIEGQNYVGKQLRQARSSTAVNTLALLVLALVLGLGLLVWARLAPQQAQAFLGQLAVSRVSPLGAAAAVAGIALCGGLFYVVQTPAGGAGRVARLEAGQRGEQAVQRVLSRLDDRWVLFTGVVVPGIRGDVDAVLIGPPGVFALEIKYWAGAIRYDAVSNSWFRRTRRHPFGERIKDPAAQAARSAAVLRRALGREVTPLVVLTDPRATYRGAHPTVPVLPLCQLLPWFQAQPEALDEGGVERLDEELRRRMR